MFERGGRKVLKGVSKTINMKFEDFSNIIVSGCSNSGKSSWVHRLIKHASKMFVTPPSKVIYVYKHWQSLYDDLKQNATGVEFRDKLPTEDELKSLLEKHKHCVLVADDMMQEINADKYGSELFTRLSHHLGMSTILLLQNGTLHGKGAGDIAKNCHYNILMRSARDRNFIRTLGVCLNDYRNLMHAYNDATKDPWSYLVVNTHPRSNPDNRYYTQIFPDDKEMVMYLEPPTHND